MLKSKTVAQAAVFVSMFFICRLHYYYAPDPKGEVGCVTHLYCNNSIGHFAVPRNSIGAVL